MLELIDRITKHLDKGTTPINVYLDLSKSFDTLDNNCDDVDNRLDNTCEVIRQETVLFSTPETDYIIYD